MAYQQIDIAFVALNDKLKKHLPEIKQFRQTAPFCLLVGLTEERSGSETLDLFHAGLADIRNLPPDTEQLIAVAADLAQNISIGAGPLCSSSSAGLLKKLADTVICLELEPLRGTTFELIVEIFGAERACCCYFNADYSDISAIYSRDFTPDQEKEFSLSLKSMLAPDSGKGSLLLPDDTLLDIHSGLYRLEGESLTRLVKLSGPSQKAYLIQLHDHEKSAGYCLVVLPEKTTLPSGLFLSNIAGRVSSAFSNSKKFHLAEELVYIDSLTELYNARYLEMVLAQEVKRAERYRSELAFIFLDLDHFKLVNDTHGHLIGSQLLVEFGELLANNVREVDSVYRFGGDEFAMLLVETGKLSGVKVAERIRRLIEEHEFCTSEGIKLKITACLGVAAFPNDTNDSKKMIELADKAMYVGKNTTRNAVHHTGSLEEKA